MNQQINKIKPIAKLLSGRFEDLTELDLRFACLSRNPTGKYVNIDFVFYTTCDRLHASIRYNKRFGTFIGYLNYDYRGFGAVWEPIPDTKAGFFTFQDAYIHISTQALLIQTNKSIPL